MFRKLRKMTLKRNEEYITNKILEADATFETILLKLEES